MKTETERASSKMKVKSDEQKKKERAVKRFALSAPNLREKAILAMILRLLRQQPDLYCWRNNSGATEIDGRFIQFGEKGSADILAVFAPLGLFVAFEVKAEEGRQTASQVEWQKRIEARGGKYFVVRNNREVVARLNELRQSVRAHG